MTASFADTDIWHVLMDDNDMKRLNVEQLDDAFRLSLVDASTMVWKAGMKTWQRLGAVAGMDDEPTEAIVRHAPPPPPRPIARPAPRPPSRAPASFHTAVTPIVQTQMLVAPVYGTPALYAPDPYVLPKRRVAIPSEVDFRRASGGVRWGRWLVALLLVTGGVLGAYRQNLLREGARKLGVEGRYLSAEHRATAFVTAKASPSVKNALTRLALLPGPNALPEPTPVAPTVTPTTAAPAATPAVATETAKTVTTTNSEPEVKTVSLDSLPVLTAEAQPAKAPVVAAAVAPAAKPRTGAVRSEPKAAAEPVHKAAKVEKAEKPEPAAKAEPAPKVKAEAPPPANESFLKSAIRSAIAADNAKKK